MDNIGKGTGNPIDRIIPANRRVTRSVSRALETQVVGSILNQIDTGIERPIDFVPTDYLNRCSDLVFGRNSGQGTSSFVRVINEFSIDTSDRSLSFIHKVKRVGEMSHGQANIEEEQACGGQRSESSRDTVQNVPMEQLMAMMRQQNEIMATCMEEFQRMRTEIVTLNRRVSEVENSSNASTVAGPGSSSTPENNVGGASTHNRPDRRSHPTGQGSNPSRLLGRLENDEESDAGDARHGTGRVDITHSLREVESRKLVDLNKWNIKFDGTGKEMTVESFIFRIEKMREQHNISVNQLFSDFPCLVTGNAAKWFWQVLEDNSDDVDFGYFELKRELLSHFKTADTDYEIIREIMDCKQQPGQDFDDYYTEIHNLTFRLKKRMPESELISIVRANLRGNIASLIFSSTTKTMAELKRECKRAEKLVKDNRQKSRPIHEIAVESTADGPAVEAIGGVNRNLPTKSSLGRNTTIRPNGKTQYGVGFTNTSDSHPIPSATGQSGAVPINNVPYCLSPFHMNLCFTCGMPGDFYRKNFAKVTQDSVCKSTFHDMKCFCCGKNDSFLEYNGNLENGALAEITGSFCQPREIPEHHQ